MSFNTVRGILICPYSRLAAVEGHIVDVHTWDDVNIASHCIFNIGVRTLGWIQHTIDDIHIGSTIDDDGSVNTTVDGYSIQLAAFSAVELNTMFEATCIDREIIDSHVVIGNIESPATNVFGRTSIGQRVSSAIKRCISRQVNLRIHLNVIYQSNRIARSSICDCLF